MLVVMVKFAKVIPINLTDQPNTLVQYSGQQVLMEPSLMAIAWLLFIIQVLLI